MKAKFKKFLIDNGAYKKFVDNLKDENNISFDEYCDKTEKWDRVFYYAFFWDYTAEGFSCWHKLNNKWLKLLK